MGLYQRVKLDNYIGLTERSHLFRYHFAKGFIDPQDVVVDIGCGAGYGTELLARQARKVIGIDRDEEAIKYATSTHKKNNNYFMLNNLDQMEDFPLCDVVVAIEIIEHLRYPMSFVGKIQQATRRKIVLSVPIVPTKHIDPTHLNDFTEQRILDIFVNKEWELIDSAKQGDCLLVVFFKK